MQTEAARPLIGEQFVEVASTASTNKLAAELAALSKLQHGAVILAHEQTMGRGQRGNSWSSGPGLDLTFSVHLRPRALLVDRQFALAQAAALAVRDTVAARLAGDVRVKWPNDVLVGERKVSGILIKNEVIGQLVVAVILGIGLNVNSVDLPAGLMATSLALEMGGPQDRMEVLRELLARLQQRWEQVEEGDPALGEAYAAHLWQRGRWAAVVIDGGPALVRPMDVDAHGRLLVEHEDGRLAAYGLDRLRFAAR